MHHNKVIVKVNTPSIFPNIIEYGLQIAQKWTYPLVLLDVKEIDKGPKKNPIMSQATTWGKIYAGRILQSTNRKLKQLTKELRKVWRYCYYELRIGSSPQRSIEQVNQWISSTSHKRPNLMIIGRENDDSFGNLLLGTEESQIAEKVKCPVLIVPKKYAYQNPKHILYILDEDEDNLQSHLEYLVQLAAPFNAKISVADIGNDFLEPTNLSNIHDLVTRELAYSNFQFHNFRHLSSPDQIIPFAEKSDPNILAVPQRSPGFKKKLYETDTTKTFILQPKMPVLIF